MISDEQAKYEGWPGLVLQSSGSKLFEPEKVPKAKSIKKGGQLAIAE